MLNKVKNKTDVIWVLASVLILLVAFDLTPLGGNILFYKTWVVCGQRPVYTKRGAGLSSGVPNYVYAPNIGLARGFMPYFCSAEQAERAGYSADQKVYSYPHLPINEWQDSIQKASTTLQG